MNLADYLKQIDVVIRRPEQQEWFQKLEKRAKQGFRIIESADETSKREILDMFRDRVRTEEIKAWYSEPEEGSLFQGTSISSLTVPYETDTPLTFNSINDLEENIADGYIELHNKHKDTVKSAILEDVSSWIDEGLYYSVVVGAKVISQAFDLSIFHQDVIFDVKGHSVDPHEITSYPEEIRQTYFRECRKRIRCFDGMELEQKELEASLVLADISKPKLDKYDGQILLAPVRCNEIAVLLAERVVTLIKEKSSGVITPRSLSIIVYDTDTPYTYHNIMGYSSGAISPVLPGLTVLGCSGTIDAFKWLYAYRVSLISQKIQKGSLYSEVERKFMPFVYFGVLVPRDAEILLDMDNLHRLRYKGNFIPDLEFAYLIPGMYKNERTTSKCFSWDEFKNKHCM